MYAGVHIFNEKIEFSNIDNVHEGEYLYITSLEFEQGYVFVGECATPEIRYGYETFARRMKLEIEY